MTTSQTLHLTTNDRRKLHAWLRGLGRKSRLGRRAAILLRAADGWSNERIARFLQTDAHTVARWRRRYLESGLAGIAHESVRSGRPRQVSIEKESAAVRSALNRNPPDGNRWSTRMLARHLKMSHSRVARFLRREGISIIQA